MADWIHEQGGAGERQQGFDSERRQGIDVGAWRGARGEIVVEVVHTYGKKHISFIP